MEFEGESENLTISTSNNHHPANPSNMVRKYLVEKLTTHNYRMWKTRMELIMERNNLKDIIDGSMKMPEQEPGRSMWKSKDLDARVEIIMHLSDDQVHYVRNLQTTNEMWE